MLLTFYYKWKTKNQPEGQPLKTSLQLSSMLESVHFEYKRSVAWTGDRNLWIKNKWMNLTSISHWYHHFPHPLGHNKGHKCLRMFTNFLVYLLIYQLSDLSRKELRLAFYSEGRQSAALWEAPSGVAESLQSWTDTGKDCRALHDKYTNGTRYSSSVFLLISVPIMQYIARESRVTIAGSGNEGSRLCGVWLPLVFEGGKGRQTGFDNFSPLAFLYHS